MKRIISILLVCFMLVALLAGCGKQAATESETSAPAESETAEAETTDPLLAELVDGKFKEPKKLP